MKPTSFPAFVATGHPAPSLCAMVGDSAPDSPGRVYAGVAWIEPHEGQWCVTIGNDSRLLPLPEAEAFLWEWYRGEYVTPDLPPFLPSPHELASGFSRVIREWLAPDELAECVRRNASEGDPGICHSHDFYDANMAMAEAWELLTSAPCYGEGSPDGANALWDAAWNLAKASNFTL